MALGNGSLPIDFSGTENTRPEKIKAVVFTCLPLGGKFSILMYKLKIKFTYKL
jgi:hypothetical protein